MRSIFGRGARSCTVLALAFALAVPFLNGCSQLGIATADELAATDTRVESYNSSANTRLDGLEKNTSDMQTTLNQITASIDTLNARFARASEWLKTMNLDTISTDAQKASAAAISAEARSAAFLAHYLEWIKAQHAALEEQITTLEAKMKQSAEGASKPPSDKPTDSGGDDGSSSEGGGG